MATVANVTPVDSPHCAAHGGGNGAQGAAFCGALQEVFDESFLSSSLGLVLGHVPHDAFELDD
jgi:hypothetical protein